MTAGGGVAGGGFLSTMSPLGLTRGSRAMIPYFGDALRAEKAVLVPLDPRVRKDDDWGASRTVAPLSVVTL